MGEMLMARTHPPSDKQPKLYQRIVDAITASVESGAYKPGQRLPSERDFAEEFKVSRPTVREAMIALEIRGVVEARQGSGVFVTARTGGGFGAEGGTPPEFDVGVFELTEARRLFEGETAALAASVITDAEIQNLERLVAEMADKNSRESDVDRADRQFHIAIAQATQNNAIVTVVENLWDLRYKSLLCRTMLARAAANRVRPVAEEHRAVLQALKTRDPQSARKAMRSHLDQVIDALFKATELETLERAKSDVEAKRSKFAMRTAI
jgi:GntR family transcriptional repressor for pyruvate dehydrogenase complex